ncbi:MAG: hypothetical protein WC184_05155 [Acidimicrobiia bacterium]
MSLRAEVDGEATDEEVAAIVAAIQATVLTAAVAPVEPPNQVPSRWRFSGRWWAKPVTKRRERPQAR